MAPKSKVGSSNERTILPEHFVDILEDAFHGLLGIILFLVALACFTQFAFVNLSFFFTVLYESKMVLINVFT